MRGHLDVDLLLGERRDARCLLPSCSTIVTMPGNIRCGVGVFVVDHEQAVLGRAVERDEADEVVVVAELPRLRGGGLVRRVEGRRVGEERVAPAQQDVGVIALGDMVVGVDAGLDLVEVEGRTRRGRAALARRSAAPAG